MQRIKLGSLIALVLFIILQLSLMGSVVVGASPLTAEGTTSTQSNQPIDQSADSSGVQFIENVGQFDDHARFQVRGGEGTIWLSENGLWITRMEAQDVTDGTDGIEAPDLMRQPKDMRQAEEQPRTGVNIKLAFVGANQTPTIEPFNRLESKVSYFIGNNPDEWQPDVPVWGGVRYVELYPGVDLEVTSQGSQLVQRLVAQEGADLDAVRLRVEGADELSLDGNQLSLETAVGTFGLPLLQVEGVDVTHLSNLSRTASQRVKRINAETFEIATPLATSNTLPNRSQLVPTDNPDALLYSTFLGGTNYDYSSSLALDDVGSAYVAGYTDYPNFPTTPGAYDTTHNGSGDVFVLKLSPDGSSLDYSTFVGGSDSDVGEALALDSAGNVVVTGQTRSSNFPTTIGGYDTTHNGGQQDAFVFKLSSDGSLLDYSTFVGGSHSDFGRGLALDSADNAYVTGGTNSSDFPTTAGAYDTTYNGDTDVFVLKLSSDGSSLDYGTFVGGESYDYAQALALDSTGNAVVTGVTDSPNFPTTAGAYDTTYNGAEPDLDPFLDHDVFVLKLSSDGSSLDYSTFVGGNSLDEGHALALDSAGNAVVTGGTDSANFPSTAGAYDTTQNGQTNVFVADVFVLKLSADGSSLDYSTFVGGSVIGDWGYGLALDSAGNAYVTGETQSPDFPTTAEAYDTTHNGSQDAFVLKLSSDGSSLDYSTFVGGSSHDDGKALALDSAGNAYITSETYSTDFPTTAGAYDTTFNGGSYDAFVMKLAMGTPFSFTEVSPVNASHDAGLNEIITATFNQAVDSGSVNNNTFALHGTQSRGLFNGSYTLNNGDLTAELAHSDEFMPGELLQATVTTDTLSADGQNLDEPYVWQFRTAVAGGSGTFADSGQRLVSSGISGVELGDLDGDGDLDAFVTGSNNNVWLNQGGAQGGTSGQFQDSGQNLNVGGDVALGDVDGDGDLDAFVANGNYQGNRVWINQGNVQGGTSGQFQDSGQALGNSRSYGVALGDLDGDGDLDAFVGNQAGAPGLTDKVWVNQGGMQGGTSGQFQDSGQDFGFLRYSTRVTLGDADNDGDLDAFVATGDTSNKVWINQGGAQGGTSGQFQDSGQNLDSASVTNIAVGDLDGDGDLDAFVANLGGPGPDFGEPDKVWINQGGAQGGTIGQFQDSGQNLGLNNSWNVALGDVDGDGDLDAFVTTDYEQANKVWINQGGLQGGSHGVFSDSGQNYYDLSSSLSYAVELGDVDNDGDLDAFIANLSDGGYVWLNKSPNLTISKTGPVTASVDSPITYTLTITNSGQLAATNVIISDTLPTNASYISGGTLAGNVVSWNVPTLAPNSTTSVQFVVTATETITNSDYGFTADDGYSATGSTSVTTVVTPAPTPDLSISKSGPATVVAGNDITYMLTITNNGAASATNLIVSDTLPTNASYISGGTLNGNEVSWNVPMLAANSTTTVQFVVTASLGTIINSDYGVTSDGDYSATGSTSVTTVVTPAPTPDLSISKSGPTTVVAGDDIIYTLTMTNNGTASATNLIISDTLPTNASYVSGGTLNGNEVSWNVPTLAQNSTTTVQFVVTASAGTVINSDYGVTSDGKYSATGSTSVTTVVTTPPPTGTPNLSISKSGTTSALAGEPITYTLRVSNTGALTATNLIISDRLPTNASYVSGGRLNGNDVSWNVPTLAPTSTISVQFVVTASAGTVINSDYGVTADGDHSATGSTSVTTVVTTPPPTGTPNLSISKSGTTSALTGEPITYTLSLSNTGALTATNLIISDTLPTNASYVSGGTLNGNEVSWNVATLAPNSTTTVQFVVTASAGTIINSDYGVTADGDHSATGSTSVTTVVTTPPPTGTPNLSISKSGATSALAGEPITYTLHISNTGSLTATNLIISDTLPTGATYVSGGRLNGNEVSWNVPSLAAGNTATVQFVVTASAGTIINSDYGVISDGGYWAMGANLVVTEISTPTSDSLLAIYALSFDTLPASDLSWAYSDAMQGLRTATANDVDKRALVLVDMPGDHNTFVYDLQAGNEALISGLPNTSGTLSSSLHEYDMTDGATLGGFLLWARNTYSADKTTFSYVGHGGALVPETNFEPIFSVSGTSGSGLSGGLFPLPTRRDAKPTFTDATPSAKILSVYQLSEALRIGSNNGANPFDVADLVHCFAASIEEFYAISPYAEAMTGSPNYAFFAPEMLGKALDAIDYSTDAHTIADKIIEEYDSAIESYDDASTPEDEHPRLLVAVDSDKIPGIKQKWDEVSYYLWQNFDKTKIETAYLNSAHYDTTYCFDANGTQDWALASPDAVVDLKTFATELGNEFASPVSVPVNTLKLLIDDAITSRYQQNGVPWFANVTPQPTWNFDNHAGIGIYADLVGTPVGSDTHLSWQAHFYTDSVTSDNPHPYAFLQGDFAGKNWADIFHRYWQGNTNLQTDACLPEFPPLPDRGELAVTQIIFPQAATVTDHSPVRFMAAISTTQPAVDTSVAFTVTQSGSTVFTEVVHIPGLLLTGTHPVQTSQVWSPVLADTTQAEPFTVEVMVDHDNHVLEPDELNNALTTSGVVAPAPVMPRPIITATVANNSQWITDTQVSLNVVQDPNSSPPNVGTVQVQLYQYSTGSSPTTQVPMLVDSQMFSGLTLPQSLNVSLSALNPGPVVLHVWAWSSGGITVYPSIVKFNYIPPNTALATGQQHDFLFHVNASDTLDLDLSTLSGDANMFMWMPTNFGTPTWSATAIGDDALTLNAPVTGEYLLSVYGESGGDYTLSTTRNGVPYARRAQARANNPNAYVPDSRPTFIEVIPKRPLPPTAITLDHLVVRSSGSEWSFLLISSLLAGLMAVMMRRGRD